MSTREASKCRELVFTDQPRGQAERAYELLSGLDDLEVERGNHANCLRIRYSLADYSLEGIEQALVEEGFHMEDGPLNHIERKLIHYREAVEFHNLNVPQWRAAWRDREIFARAYEHHLHGDHDDTPQELREYR